MRFRNTQHAAERVEPQMAPMIDVVFQLLIFFMLTFKVIEAEGSFSINMPIGAPAPSQTNDIVMPDIKVRMTAGEDGSLAMLRVGNTNLGNDEFVFDRLNSKILEIIGFPGNPLMKDVEVEIDADFNLHYHYVLNAVSASTGRMQDGRQIRYVEKVKFAPPRVPEGQ